MHHRTCGLILAFALLASPAAADVEDASPGIRLAEEMIGAYQAVESYHARWLLLIEDEAGDLSRSEVEVAFDRGSGMLLVRRQACGEDGGAAGPEGELLISDGHGIRLAWRLGWSAPSTAQIDPDAMTYWVIERALSFQPIDVPLLLGESPLLGWLHMTGGSVDAPATQQEDGEPLQEFRVSGAGEGDSVNARLDAASFIREATRAEHKLTFLLKSLSVNEPLSSLTFDFEAQSAFLGSAAAEPPDLPTKLRAEVATGTGGAILR
jgi:hypothetical protein